MVMQELPQPKKAHILLRGAYDAPARKSPRRLPAFCRRCLPTLRGIASASPAG
jgi:hypothetical protein